jgi:RimJ/RimL family protein N-acetyltransferase
MAGDAANIKRVRIQGARLVLRPFATDEIGAEWQEMVSAEPIARGGPVAEQDFKARLAWSGELRDGWLDLAIELDGTVIGRIQTFVPPERETPPDVFTIGIGLRRALRGHGHGREAMTIFTGWLFSDADASVVQAPTDPDNIAMRSVFERIGWHHTETYQEFGRTWVSYSITRPQWEELHAGRVI